MVGAVKLMISGEWCSFQAIAVNAGSSPATIPFYLNFAYMETIKKRIATLGITEEMRRMAVGDVVQFPLSRYNNNSVRSTPGSTLVQERINGMRWKTRMDYDNKCVEVIRTA